MPKPKRKCIFQPFIFMGCGYISFRKVRFLEYQSQDFFQRKTWCLRLCGSRVFFVGFGVNSSYLAHMGVSKNKGGPPKLIMNFHRVGTIIFTMHFGVFIPIFGSTPIWSWNRWTIFFCRWFFVCRTQRWGELVSCRKLKWHPPYKIEWTKICVT